MRKSIRVLPKELAEKIAAGEVVERPASVIKELVENSLDAGARHVRVELEEGGRRRIAILDDGHGIADDEMLVALERHATSKIGQLDDLWNLHTLGFRGEALPSIAAVSRFTLESRVAEARRARQLYLEGGTLKRDGTAPPTSALNAYSSGTLIVVEDLFFNVPARLKFLKSKSSEASLIRELIERIALCVPAVGFTLISDGRKLLQLGGAGEAERVAQVLETEPANLESFESQFEDITIRGWLDRDGRAPNSRHVFLAVNGRMVRDKLLQQAVLVGLRPRMMEGEFPRIFLTVDVNPSDVDVIVHPAKSEVRFRRARDVFQVVHGALDKLARTSSKAFYSAALSTSADAAADRPELTAPTPRQSDPAPQAATPSLFHGEQQVAYKTKNYLSFNLGGMLASFEAPESGSPEESGPPVFTSSGVAMSEAQSDSPSPRETSSNRVLPTPGFSALQYIGQLKNTYLLFQSGDGLVVIDQHAAHERINYEALKARFLLSGLRAQPLLISAVVKCRPEDIGVALEHSESFSKLGFEFEAFGDNCIMLRAAPEGLAPDRASELFRTLLGELGDSDSAAVLAEDPTRLSPKVERLLATSACHSSVRAGQALSPKEARELAVQMDETESSLNCPHGRPASIRLTYNQIEGLFKR